MRVALVHDWLTGMRGGERVLEALCELYPDADVYTLLSFPDRISPALASRRVTTSFVQQLPGVRRHYRYYLPVFPTAIESFDLSAYDLVISSSHCVAKGARVREGALHISYVHTPMRYAWGMLDQYLGDSPLSVVGRGAFGLVLKALRSWDRRTADRVHHFVANSENVARRIHSCYGRTAEVIYPPIDTARFRPGERRDDFYLIVSALVPYKRLDLAMAAARLGHLPVLVAGEGPERAHLEKVAGPSVRFLGRVSDEALADLYGRARGLLFPGVEDFGMVPVEAMAGGCPVVAYAAGGALESVVDLDDPRGRPPTGALFGVQTPEALLGAIHRLDARRAEIDPATLGRRAAEFDRHVFLERMRGFVDRRLEGQPGSTGREAT